MRDGATQSVALPGRRGGEGGWSEKRAEAELRGVMGQSSSVDILGEAIEAISLPELEFQVAIWVDRFARIALRTVLAEEDAAVVHMDLANAW